MITPSSILRGGGGAVIFGIFSFLGTVFHGSTMFLFGASIPVGLIITVLTLVAAGVALRAALGPAGLIGAAVGAFIVTQALTVIHPGGDVIVAGTLTGYAWLFAAPTSVLPAVFLPRRWFRGAPGSGRRNGNSDLRMNPH